ncbi:MAG: hypothetical protein OEW12_08675 [Deltaproteobacteria bacterium]|nr:hypothetical protein [Deltaproteobacteria bacterium]
MAIKKIRPTLTNHLTLFFSIGFFIIGIGCLFFSETDWVKGFGLWVKSAISNFGGVIVATSVITIFWDLIAKRAFLNEILDTTKLVEEIRIFGLRGISNEPIKGPDFTKLIKNTTNLDVFFCYAKTWRSNNESALRDLSKKAPRVRLIVPNPENKTLMDELGKRFGKGHSEIQKYIQDAIDDFKIIFSNKSNTKVEFSVWVHDQSPVESFYIFDSYAIITFYKQNKGRSNAITLECEKGGGLYEFLVQEVNSMIKGIDENGPLAKKIFPDEKDTVRT